MDFIRAERKKRRTWEEISQEIREKGTACSRQGVRDYFKRRKDRKPQLGFEPDPPKPTQQPSDIESEYNRRIEEQTKPAKGFPTIK